MKGFEREYYYSISASIISSRDILVYKSYSISASITSSSSFFFGVFVRNGGAVLLDREKSNMSSFFSDIKQCTKAGDSIFIFPEGTRNKSENDLGEFKSGSQIIAIKNRLNMLPVYIRSNANEQLMSSLKDGKVERTIEIEIGDIIEYKDKSMTLEEAYKSQFNLK